MDRASSPDLDRELPANRALLTAAVLLATALVSPAEARPPASRPPAHPQGAAAPLINIAKTADLAFGQVVTGSTLGTVVVTPAGARSSTGGTTLGSASGAGPATFTVTALPLTAYSIVLPASATLSSGAASMTVNPFASVPNGSGQVGLGGSQTLSVGGTLKVGANQASGNYTGTFNVTVTVP